PVPRTCRCAVTAKPSRKLLQHGSPNVPCWRVCRQAPDCLPDNTSAQEGIEQLSKGISSKQRKLSERSAPFQNSIGITRTARHRNCLPESRFSRRPPGQKGLLYQVPGFCARPGSRPQRRGWCEVRLREKCWPLSCKSSNRLERGTDKGLFGRLAGRRRVE